MSRNETFWISTCDRILGPVDSADLSSPFFCGPCHSPFFLLASFPETGL